MELTVTISELTSAAQKIAQANESFREAATALKQAADALADTWEGDAHEIFVQEQEQIDQWYKQMANVVDTYVAAMKQTASDYEATDAAAVGIING